MTSTKSNENSQNSTTKTPVTVKPYGQVVLTLKNQLLPEDKISLTPSQSDGLDAETETDLRIYGCELIQTAGILLKLPQVSEAALPLNRNSSLMLLLLLCLGRNGHGAGAVAAVLLLKKSGATSGRPHSDGMCVSRFKDRRGAQTRPRRD